MAPGCFRDSRSKRGRALLAAGCCPNAGVDFMIGYSAYGRTNYLTKPGAASSNLRCSLEAEYREPLESRERVTKAEAAALRLKPRVSGHTKNVD